MRIRNAWAALALSVGALAQPPQPSFHVKTQLVEVSVVVKDGHGNPVRDLKADDFALFDNSRRQEIRVFRIEDHRNASSHPASSPPSRSGTFSNRIPLEPDAPNPPTVVLVDAGNTWSTDRMTWQDLVFARQELIKFLSRIRPEDRLGIYLMGPDRFWVLHEYNRNCADLLHRLAAWKTRREPDPLSRKCRDVWTEFAVRMAGVDAETAKAIHRSQFWYTGDANPGPVALLGPAPVHGEANQAFRALSAFDVLVSVADHLASVPGRKNIILISGTMFLPKDHAVLVQVLHPLIRAGTAIYTIDPGGLAPYALDASFAIPSSVTASAMDPSQAALAYMHRTYAANKEIAMYLQSSLSALAEATGGQAFVDTNDIHGAIANSFDDSRISYSLGFYPDRSRNDGSFHSLKVELPARREEELRKALWSPVDASLIELNGGIAPVPRTADHELTISIGLANVDLQPEGDRWRGRIEVILVQRDNAGNEYDGRGVRQHAGQREVLIPRDDSGTEYQRFAQELGLKLTQQTFERAVVAGLPYRRVFRLNPNTTSIRILVRDFATGNLGSLTIPAPGL